MKLKANEIIGLPIQSESEGKRIGYVHDLILDVKKAQVKAIVVKRKTLLQEAQVILWDDLESVSDEQVRISSSSMIVGGTTAPPPIPAVLENPKDVEKTELKSVDGQELGRTHDVIVDTDTGSVEAIETKSGQDELQIPIEQILTVSRKETVVKPRSAPIKEKSARSLDDKIEELKQKTEKSLKYQPKSSLVRQQKEVDLPVGTTFRLPNGAEFVTRTSSKLRRD
jgi:uncharacterized protein YrrD